MIVLQENPHLAGLVRERLERHYAADEIIKGVYWQEGKGCAVGCITESNEPYSSPIWNDIGIGLFLPKLCDTIFEGLPDKLAKEFPIRFWTAIESAKGKDLGLVHWKFLHWLLSDELRQYHDHEIVGESIVDVMNGIELLAIGKSWANAVAYAAANAAYAAARAAARAARASNASNAAYAAARAAARAANAAANAAYAAANAAANAAAYVANATYVAYAAAGASNAANATYVDYAAANAANAAREANAYGRQANKLIELIETA
jgi:hypothetical protein